MSRLRKALFLVSCAGQERLAYPAQLVGSAGFLVVLLFVFRQLYLRALPPGVVLAGFDAGAVLWYLVLTEAIALSFPRLDGEVDEEVKTGALAAYLTRPVSYLEFHQFKFLGAALANLVVNLTVGSLLGFGLAGPPPFGAAGLGAFLGAAALAFAIQFQLAFSLALTAFWVEDAKPFFWVYQKCMFILGGLMIPLDFFPPTLRALAEALPLSQLLYAPARLALDPSPAAAARVLGAQALWLTGLGLVARVVYRRGLRKLTVLGG